MEGEVVRDRVGLPEINGEVLDGPARKAEPFVLLLTNRVPHILLACIGLNSPQPRTVR